ncbi:MAG: amidohydrolase family protein [Gemmatimonadales bacterium]
MSQIDINTFIGAYPWRDVGPANADDLLREMLRCGSSAAWVSHLAAMFRYDPMASNAELYAMHYRDARLHPVPAVHPGLPGWEAALDEAIDRNAPAVRADPMFYGLAPAGDEMRRLVAACAEHGIPLMIAVRLEDIRQRHPNDRAGDLPSWAVRQLVRSHPDVRLIITHADREFVEQVHFGSTPAEASRILWDICWIWGPPEDHLELLLRTVGPDRFAFGTGMPLRLPEAALAKVDLLNLDVASRERLVAGNVGHFVRVDPSA